MSWSCLWPRRNEKLKKKKRTEKEKKNILPEVSSFVAALMHRRRRFWFERNMWLGLGIAGRPKGRCLPSLKTSNTLGRGTITFTFSETMKTWEGN